MQLILPFLVLGVLVCTSPVGARDCNQNGSDDRVDVTDGTSPDCNGNLIPDECDIVVQSPGLSVFSSEPLKSRPSGIGVDDFNGDGELDLLVAGRLGFVTLLLDNGERSTVSVPEGSGRHRHRRRFQR